VKKIEILNEDDSYLVINKPAGLAVQGGAGVAVSVDRVLAEMRSPRPLLVHRLDKDTSGVMLVAKTREAAARFSRLLGEERAASGVIKQYLAVCAGRPQTASGTVRLDLEIRGKVKKSETRWRLVNSGAAETAPCSLLELDLGTGRTHQIRRHLALSGVPVLGDDKYGDFTLNKKLRKVLGLKRLLLHASRLIIPPEGGVPELDFSAPVPDYFAAFLARAGMETPLLLPGSADQVF
jgi:23S rRNA pseudouridine955/2504/2580 synthase